MCVEFGRRFLIQACFKFPISFSFFLSILLSSISRWYFGKIKRMEAEKKLLLTQNEHGAFLIRDSESRRNDYSLSVRDGDTVKHYRIRQLDEGGFFIARRTTFRTLQELVDHYSRDADGLCVNLRKPCIQVCNFFFAYSLLFHNLQYRILICNDCLIV